SLRPRGTRRRALSLRDDRAAPGFHPHRSSAAGRARSGVPLPRASADLAVPRAGLDPLLVGIPRAHAHFGHARARRALPRARPALTMRTAIAKLNAERAARGELVVAFGIGMHTGDVILGAIGLPERSQYDAIGDAVNTASRMETLTKEFKVDAVLSGDTAARL